MRSFKIFKSITSEFATKAKNSSHKAMGATMFGSFFYAVVNDEMQYQKNRNEAITSGKIPVIIREEAGHAFGGRSSVIYVNPSHGTTGIRPK